MKHCCHALTGVSGFLLQAEGAQGYIYPEYTLAGTASQRLGSFVQSLAFLMHDIISIVKSVFSSRSFAE